MYRLHFTLNKMFDVIQFVWLICSLLLKITYYDGIPEGIISHFKDIRIR